MVFPLGLSGKVAVQRLTNLLVHNGGGSAERRRLNRSEKSSEYQRSKVDDKVDRVTVVQRIT